jgi:hypothetical protein
MQTVTFGRGSQNDVVFSDMTVSGTHCRIEMDDAGRITITDLNSTNGTRVNGVAISSPTILNPSDVVKIGNTTLDWQQYFNTSGTVVSGESSGSYSGSSNRGYSRSSGGYSGSSYRDDDSDSKKSEGINVVVFLLGLISAGLIAYIIISFFSSGLYAFGSFFGGSEAGIKLFPLYLKGFMGIGGKWGLMIAAIVLGIAADIISALSSNEDNKLCSVGLWLGNAGVSVGAVFMVMAIFF